MNDVDMKELIARAVRLSIDGTKLYPLESTGKRILDDADVLYHIVLLAKLDEREQIAQMIEDAPTLVEFAQNENGGCLMCGFTPKLAATAIRARGQA